MVDAMVEEPDPSVTNTMVGQKKAQYPYIVARLDHWGATKIRTTGRSLHFCP